MAPSKFTAPGEISNGIWPIYDAAAPAHRSYADSYDRDLALIVEADRLGYHEAWIGEHITERWENAPCPDLVDCQGPGHDRSN